MTGLDLVSASLSLIGALASSETATSAEATNALQALNDMIDVWSTQSLTIPAKVEETFALTVNQQTYTWGSGGNFNSARPQRIENALIQLPTSTPVINLPMEILNKDQWASITIPALGSTFPIFLYADGAYPLTNVNVWPIPTAACSLVLFSWKPLSQIAALNTALSFPPGYQEALKFNLAVRLAPEYGRILPDTVTAIAIDSLANIKRMNVKPIYMMVDPELRSKSGVYDWRSDGYLK